jgi:hypothetical protein
MKLKSISFSAMLEKQLAYIHIYKEHVYKIFKNSISNSGIINYFNNNLIGGKNVASVSYTKFEWGANRF